jgi:hypothetical protein
VPGDSSNFSFSISQGIARRNRGPLNPRRIAQGGVADARVVNVVDLVDVENVLAGSKGGTVDQLGAVGR